MDYANEKKRWKKNLKNICKKENVSLKMRIRVFEMEENFYQEKIKELEVDNLDLKNKIVEIHTSIGRFLYFSFVIFEISDIFLNQKSFHQKTSLV
jgi:hypothetical protein